MSLPWWLEKAVHQWPKQCQRCPVCHFCTLTLACHRIIAFVSALTIPSLLSQSVLTMNLAPHVGVGSVVHVDSAEYENLMPENYSTLVQVCANAIYLPPSLFGFGSQCVQGRFCVLCVARLFLLYLQKLQEAHKFSHVVAAHTAFGKSVIPRIAARLDSQPIPDVVCFDLARQFIPALRATMLPEILE